MNRKEFLTWCYDWDVHVQNDISDDCECEESDCFHIYSVYAIQTLHDPSVGIFGQLVTPYFRTEEELMEYVSIHQVEIEDELG